MRFEQIKIDWKRILLPAALVIGLAFLFFYKLGSHPIIDWDEGIYAQVARQSLQQRSQIDLHWLGSVEKINPAGLWFEKPPLAFWLMEFSYKAFGINEFAARFWNALFALGTVILTYALTMMLFKSRLAGIISLLLFYLAHFFITQAWFFGMDIMVTFFNLLAIIFFIRAERNEKYFYLFWLSLGAGFMAKSVIGLLPLPIIIIYSFWNGRWKLLKSKHFYYGVLAFLAVAAPWHIVETLRHGRDFWAVYLGLHVLDRFTKSIDNNSHPFWFYLQNMKDNPAFLCLTVCSLAYFIWSSFKSVALAGQFRLVTAGVIFIFIFFSSSVSKRAAYIVVIYPMLIIMSAKALSNLAGAVGRLKIRYGFLALFSAVCLVSGFLFNASKVNNDGYYANYYKENRLIAEFINKNFPGFLVLTENRDAPSLMFYLNRPVYAWNSGLKLSKGSLVFISKSSPKFGEAVTLAAGKTTNLYLVTVR